MIRLSNSKWMLIFTKLLILLVVAKGVSLLIWWSCPSEGVELSIKENYQPKYQRVNFKNMIEKDKSQADKAVKQTADGGINITNMILKALYGTKDKGYAIVAMKATPKKTSIIEIDESFRGYRLVAILPKSAKFHRDGSEFILSLDKIKETSATVENRLQDSNIAIDKPAIVSRGDISYYAKNPKQIWKDISIKEIRDGKKIKGFKVTKINPNSRFARLGLQRGDLIIKANNMHLRSYREALQIYKKIDKLDAIQIVVMRNNQEVELVYEIN
ncbi:MAG: PDZ domain-containing protein [Campylobacterota bacterium]|nr:PDZ domain-containing protein [Campylobacterota bacterium]